MSDLITSSDIDAFMASADNASARASLGLAVGSDVQAFNARLADVAGLAPTDNGFLVGNGTNFVLESAETARTSLGLGALAVLSSAAIGVNVDWVSIGDVPDMSASPASGDKLLIFEAGVGFRKIDWDELPSGGGGASTLDALTNVVITSPLENHVLAYDSATGDWVNIELFTQADVFNLSASATTSVTIGNSAGRNMTGTRNVAVGDDALGTMSAGFDNVAIGYQAGRFATSNANTMCLVGKSAGASIISGGGATLVGANAGNSYANMTDCTIIGSGADTSASGETGSIAIGKSVVSSGVNGLNIGNVIKGTMTSGGEVIRFTGSSSSSADPTTTELPNARDWGIHKNTTSGNVFIAYNDGGTIRKVQLT